MLDGRIDARRTGFCACDRDAAVGAVGGIEGAIARSGCEEELEVREAGEGFAGKRGAFAHGQDDVEGVQAGDELVLLGGDGGVEGAGEGLDGDAVAEVGEVRGGDALVVVEDGELHV